MVYFISNGKNIKIGYAKDVKKRLSSLQTGSDKKLFIVNEMEGGRILEKLLNEKFESHKVINEWYALPSHFQQLTTGQIGGLYNDIDINAEAEMGDVYIYNKNDLEEIRDIIYREKIPDILHRSISVNQFYDLYSKHPELFNRDCRDSVKRHVDIVESISKVKINIQTILERSGLVLYQSQIRELIRTLFIQTERDLDEAISENYVDYSEWMTINEMKLKFSNACKEIGISHNFTRNQIEYFLNIEAGKKNLLRVKGIKEEIEW